MSQRKKTNKEPKGGTYTLDDDEGNVQRSGRSKDLKKREGDHARNPLFRLLGLIFNPRDRTDDYAEQRGLEQQLHDEHNPPLNKIKPISDKNKNKKNYEDAAENYKKRQKKK